VSADLTCCHSPSTLRVYVPAVCFNKRHFGALIEYSSVSTAAAAQKELDGKDMFQVTLLSRCWTLIHALSTRCAVVQQAARHLLAEQAATRCAPRRPARSRLLREPDHAPPLSVPARFRAGARLCCAVRARWRGPVWLADGLSPRLRTRHAFTDLWTTASGAAANGGAAARALAVAAAAG
jgi:hypothetical protein